MSFQDKISGLLGVCMHTFGEPATYTPQGGEPVEIRTIFDAIYEEVDPDTRAIVMSAGPRIGIRGSDLPQVPKQGDTVVVRGDTYRVTEVQPDGRGGITLPLHKL